MVNLVNESQGDKNFSCVEMKKKRKYMHFNKNDFSCQKCIDFGVGQVFHRSIYLLQCEGMHLLYVKRELLDYYEGCSKYKLYCFFVYFGFK